VWLVKEASRIARTHLGEIPASSNAYLELFLYYFHRMMLHTIHSFWALDLLAPFFVVSGVVVT